MEYELFNGEDNSASPNIRRLLADDASIIIALNDTAWQKESSSIEVPGVDGQVHKPVGIEKLLVMMKELLNY